MEVFIHSCKEVYEAAEGSILDEHHSYKWEYTNLLECTTFYMHKMEKKSYLGPNVTLYEPYDVILALLDEPLARQYTKLIEFTGSFEPTFEIVEAEAGGVEDIPGREQLIPLIESSKYIKAAE